MTKPENSFDLLVKKVGTLSVVQRPTMSKSESVRLRAIKDILDRAGFKPVDRQEIHQVSEFAGWSDQELNAEYKRLMQTEMERHERDQQMVGMFEHENYLEEGFEDN